jgi:hypothetical protein
MKYRKKSLVIDAWNFTGQDENEWPDWMREYQNLHGTVIYRNKKTNLECLCFPTLDGVRVASIGDWVIKDARGGVYPCKAEFFDATYEKVDEARKV